MAPRKFVLRQPVVVDVGCSCRKPKLPQFLTLNPKKVKPNNSKTSSQAAEKEKKEWTVDESVLAEVKDSANPYVDFRESMVQMIVEMDIRSWDDLRDLLHRFLAVNAPYHHHLIVRAFAEVWNGLYAPRAPETNATSPAPAALVRKF